MERIRAELPMSPELEYLLQFMEETRMGRNGRFLDRPSRK
jgi:hypothetical protein